MKLCPFALILIYALFLVCPAVASEYPQDNHCQSSCATKAEVRAGDDILADKITSLRESYAQFWIEAIAALITVGALIFAVVGLLSFWGMRDIKTDAQKAADETEKYMERARLATDQILNFMRDLGIHETTIRPDYTSTFEPTEEKD